MTSYGVAKYNENISWSHYLPVPVTVYDKSKDIPNIGREGETFLRHIVPILELETPIAYESIT